MKNAAKFLYATFAAILITSPVLAQGTAKTKSSLGTELNTQFPDQLNGYISPLLLRNVINDIVSSFQQFASVNSQIGTTYTFQASDYGQLVTFNNASAIAVTIPTTSAPSTFYPFNTYASNLGAGTVTITPTSGTINGASNFALTQNQSIWIVSDGANWQVFRGANSATLGPFATQTAPCTIAQGCSSQTTALADRGPNGFNIDQLTSTGDANFTIPSTARGVYHTALSAARTDTLPAAASVNAGQEFHIMDFAGVSSGSNTITLLRSGSDTINGTTSVVAINAQYGAGIFWSDGVSRWTFQPISYGGGGGSVTSITCGTGLSGGTITTSGTCALSVTLPGGRLTTSSGVCIPVTDVVAATSIYYAPCSSPYVTVYNGTTVQAYNFTSGVTDTVGLSLALGSNWAASTLYDVFATINSGNPVLCTVAWSSSGAGTSARATSLATYAGIQTNSTSATCRISNSSTMTMSSNQGTYLGTFLTNANTGQIDFKFGSAAAGGGTAVAGVWNLYNQVKGTFSIVDTNANWGVSSLSTYQPLDVGTSGGLNNRLTFITGNGSVAVDGIISESMTIPASQSAALGFGLNTTSGVNNRCVVAYGSATSTTAMTNQYTAQCSVYGSIGLNYLQGIQYSSSGSTAYVGGSTGDITASWWW